MIALIVRIILSKYSYAEFFAPGSKELYTPCGSLFILFWLVTSRLIFGYTIVFMDGKSDLIGITPQNLNKQAWHDITFGHA